MKKIAAFITSAIICIIIISVFHFGFSHDLRLNNKEFGTWYNPFKDLASGVIAQNLHDDTMPVFGSSEFKHGRQTIYHPKNIFRNHSVSLMTIGGPYNQCLNHTVMLGAISPKMKKRKAVLLLSPTWFYKNGVRPDRYGLRFSESAYMSFMENKTIPDETKRYVANRTESLMADSGSVLHRIMEIDRIFVDKKAGEIAKLAYGLRKRYVRDKDVLTLKGLLKAEQIKKKKKYVSKENDETPIDWDEMFAKAKNETFKTNNPYYIRARNWNLKFKHRFKIAKNLHKKENFLRSPEYDDLEAFLQVCRAEKIKPLLVILPLNGRWYDYTGLKKDKRKVFADKITEYAQAYGAKLENFSKYDYVPYFLFDAAHPAGQGWVKIDEAIYDYYKEN